jgi:hypothetical protein
VIRLSAGDLPLAARVRLEAGVQMCDAEDGLWLLGDENRASECPSHSLLPGGHRYRVLADGQLVGDGKSVPDGRLPAGPWRPLATEFSLRLPPAGFLAPLAGRAAWTLVRDDVEREADLLVTAIAAWARYAESAPAIRLDRWRFAAGSRGRVVVEGAPIPPLAGRVYVVERDAGNGPGGIAVPCGWRREPRVEAGVLRAAFGLHEGDVALLEADGSWEHVRSGDFVRAARAAVRATAKEVSRV